LENLNAGRRAASTAREAASKKGGNKFLAETQEQRAEERRVARERLDRASFFRCCWEILVFRLVREVAQDALGLITWGDLRGDLVETCRFPTTWARIHALDEACTPEYRECPADESTDEDSPEAPAAAAAAEVAAAATAEVARGGGRPGPVATPYVDLAAGRVAYGSTEGVGAGAAGDGADAVVLRADSEA